MRLIDLDQTIFVPIIDESKGGVSYEMQMTVEELFQKFFDGNVPEVVDAVPVEWLKKRREQLRQKEYGGLGVAAIAKVLMYWQEEKEDKHATD